MTEKVRPVLPEKIAKAVQRYATANSISTTAAVALLLTQILIDLKYMERSKT
jgi:hypothetical protein